MKRYISIALLVGLMGCTTSQQQTSFNTLWTLELSTKTAYDGYLTAVVQGVARTNEVPQITKLFNDFQAASLLAESAVQYNTNALAPTALVQESSDLVTLITTISAKK